MDGICKECGKQVDYWRPDGIRILSDRRRKYCYKCRPHNTRNKKGRSEAVVRCQNRKKQRAVEYLGGKCQRCGYNRCLAAMCFHHVGEKNFTPSYIIHSRSWEQAKQELDKCMLLCANCHMEEHHGVFTPEPAQRTVQRIEGDRSCPQCSKVFKPYYNKQIFCSRACSAESCRVVSRPSPEALKAEIENETWTTLGKKYGVSHTTVQRWAKRYGID